MTHGQKALFRAVVLTVGFSLAAAQSAQATLLLAGTAGGINFCAADNNVACTFGRLDCLSRAHFPPPLTFGPHTVPW